MRARMRHFKHSKRKVLGSLASFGGPTEASRHEADARRQEGEASRVADKGQRSPQVNLVLPFAHAERLGGSWQRQYQAHECAEVQYAAGDKQPHK